MCSRYFCLLKEVIETQKIDLLIYANKNFHIENVKYDEDKWVKEIIPELTNFYFEFISISILYKAN